MLFAPTLAERAILPTALGGSYFFNRIGQKRPLISWQSTAEKALWKQLLTRSPIFGGMDALLISHKHSFLLALATCCEARAYAAFGYNWLIPRSI
ncbi:hypothetical protein EGJ86_23055 [Pseudomonas sp. o96-267]|uniref:hypothetical protein n=1 Tax=Pseudomonas sp. o96-267 TaxID=2479853 RepID=UPI000F792A02|nr:hypothetical protein [Pseudomonas sp. o96-267]RRV29287.1 hypothetical protein EGJ86_23055 [Pseudomonas sp. o96-267]